ncbi:family 20 glycosylhydrolase [bacterium]|nr:family 20 glycosylhydrolase [bacterium]
MHTRFLLVFLLVFATLAAYAQPLLSPAPKRFVAGESFSLPSSYRLSTSGLSNMRDDPGLVKLQEMLQGRGCRESKDAEFVVELGLISKSKTCQQALAGIASTDHLPDHPEAFFVRLSPSGALVGGRSPRAVYYGLLSLAQWLDASAGSTTGGWLLDWPSLDHRAYMIDSARLMEQKDYYRKMLRILSESRYNVMLWHLTDYPAVTLRFDKHPEPADPNAWTPAEVRELHQLARRFHIDLMPEVELFGHAGGFTRHPRYKQLGEGRGGGSFNPLHPETYRLTGDLVQETAGLFPFALFHAGLDEVNPPTSAEGEAFVKEHGMNRWLTDHIQKIHAQITTEKRRMVMWGDMLLKRPGTAFAMPRDIIIYDWHYYCFEDSPRAVRDYSGQPPETWSYFRQMGFDVVAAPALSCGSYRLWPDYRRINNCVNSATLAAEYGLLGLGVTVWAPARYLPDSIWYSTRLAGDAAWAGRQFARAAADAAFFRDFYGLDLNPQDRRHLDFMLHNTPTQGDLNTLLWVDEDSRKRFLESRSVLLSDRLREAEAAADHFETRLADVKRHRAEYRDFVLVARVLEHLAWRAEHGRRILTDPAAGALREQCRRRNQQLLDALVASWKLSRHGDPSTGQYHDPQPHGF